MLQDLKSKAGEVKFRAQLYEQQVLGNEAIPGELSSTQMLAAMRERMQKTRSDLEPLGQANLLQPPFLELGAERCQRSLVLANDFGLDGFAADLSLDSLRYAEFLASQEGLSRIPQRVCCDAHKLPFADNSIGFAFCYQTLHHFPDPTPIVQELYRVLRPGAVLYVNEEPIRRTWKVNLWRRHVRPKGAENKYWRYAKDYILDFISEPHVNEVEYGICENDDITLRQWERIFGETASKGIQLRMLPLPKSLSQIKHSSGSWGLRSWLCQGLGGILTATVEPKKAGSRDAYAQESLCCPVCRGQLSVSEASFTCAGCSARYPVQHGIPLLLPQEELHTLYSESA
jgi:SAM-dependent methyltransferase/uncharacterized protein YbaR (Trm112 family)